MSQLSLPGQFQYFLLGILLADWYATDFRRSPGKSYGWDAIGLLAAWSGKLIHPAWPFWLNYLIQSALLAASLLILCALLFVIFKRPFMRPLRPSGGGSRPAGTPAHDAQSSE